MKFDRRQALGLLGLGAMPVAARAAAKAGFNHGVASGDPLQDRVVIWTRLTPEDASQATLSADYYVARADRPGRKVRQGRAFTSAARDYTIKIDVDGLEPGRDYVFGFEAGGVKSPVGLTRTLPKGPTEDAVLAVASCALWPGGFFNAYEAISKLERCDAVVHLGDYIYEYGPDGFGGDIGAKIGRVPDPPREILTLADYRARHAQAKSDAHLQAAHARAPWIVVWDDHEVANDSWATGAENHQPATEGGWFDRKAAALRAWYEWMPIREPGPGGTSTAIQRSFHFGDLASLIMVETRLTARTQPLEYATDLMVDGKPDGEGFAARLGDPARTMMGERQEAWLANELAASVAAGRRWQVLGNQVVMARVAMPDVRKSMSEDAYATMLGGLPEDVRALVVQAGPIAAAGLPYNLDAWDGYPAARERLYGAFKAANATPIVLSGDSHAFWANELYDIGGENRVAAEFGGTGITSPGIGDVLVGAPINSDFAQRNREVLFTDHAAKGFFVLALTREAATAEMMAVSTVYSPQYETRTLKRFTVEPAERGVGPVRELS
ncbi:MAG TPA: alkaline phosphatase D family protein [Caulobacteraceae bacterium]